MSFEDIAQDIELKQWELINLARRPVALTKYEPEDSGYGPAECDQCGNDMPVERRAWGYDLCVPCKQLTEPRRR